MSKSILFVVTSHDQLGNTGKKTGSYIPEVAHPYQVLTKHGYKITFASPLGGSPPIDPGSLTAFQSDPEVVAFLADSNAQKALASSLTLDKVKVSDYAALVYPGGHGPMWDLVDDTRSHALIREAFESGKFVASVCHGPAGLARVKLSDGSYLVCGKRVSGFTNSEEEAVGLTSVVPFLLEDELKKNGGKYELVADWQPLVVVDGKLITGQNPASAQPMAEKLVELLK